MSASAKATIRLWKGSRMRILFEGTVMVMVMVKGMVKPGLREAWEVKKVRARVLQRGEEKRRFRSRFEPLIRETVEAR